MTDEEIRAKALEIAVLIKGEPAGRLSENGDFVIRQYLWLADSVEQYIRGTLKPSLEEPAEN